MLENILTQLGNMSMIYAAIIVGLVFGGLTYAFNRSPRNTGIAAVIGLILGGFIASGFVGGGSGIELYLQKTDGTGTVLKEMQIQPGDTFQATLSTDGTLTSDGTEFDRVKIKYWVKPESQNIEGEVDLNIDEASAELLLEGEQIHKKTWSDDITTTSAPIGEKTYMYNEMFVEKASYFNIYNWMSLHDQPGGEGKIPIKFSGSASADGESASWEEKVTLSYTWDPVEKSLSITAGLDEHTESLQIGSS